MRARLGGNNTRAQIQKYAVPAPGVRALAVRPCPVSGQAQALVVCHFGICPLRYEDGSYARLEPPLKLRNVPKSMFRTNRVYDAAYDAHSGLVLFAHGSSIYGMDAENTLTRLAGDDGTECLLGDGPAHDARFVGAQRLAPDGSGLTYIRDRDSASRNGFCLRALHEASLPMRSADGHLMGSGTRAVVTIRTSYDTGPQALTFDPHRRALLFTTRGRAVHKLGPHGLAGELVGSEDTTVPLYACHAANLAAAAASASSASDTSDASDTEDLDAACELDPAVPTGGPPLGSQSQPGPRPQPLGQVPGRFTNVQSLAADGETGNVYLLEGTSSSATTLLVLRPDGAVEVLARRLRVAPPGNSHLPRLAVLPAGHLAIYSISAHDMMLLKL